jgi:hypothetical protein
MEDNPKQPTLDRLKNHWHLAQRELRGLSVPIEVVVEAGSEMILE